METAHGNYHSGVVWGEGLRSGKNDKENGNY